MHKQKTMAAMIRLVRENWPSYLGALAATVMIVLIGFITPMVLATTIDSVLNSEPCARTCG